MSNLKIADASQGMDMLLMDRIKALEQEHRDLFDRAEKSVMEVMAERDEARKAVKRLEAFARDIANTVPYRITGEALTPTQLRELIDQISRHAETVLSDPSVKRIV